MNKKTLIYGMIVMLLVVSLFVLTGCSNDDVVENVENDATSNEEQQASQETEKIKGAFEAYGLKDDDLLPKFENKGIRESAESMTVYIDIPEEKEVSLTEIEEYRLQIANACKEASDDGKVYDMTGTKELTDDAEKKMGGLYVYTYEGVKYRIICNITKNAGNPITLVIEKA